MPENPVEDPKPGGDNLTTETYNRKQTVQANNTVVPSVTEPAYVSPETSPTVIKNAKTSAAARLKRKNRKKNEFYITMPITLQIEAGEKYNVSGFTASADAQDWIVGEVEIRMSGKHGSETRVTLMPSMAQITADTQPSTTSTSDNSNIVATHTATQAQIDAANKAGFNATH